MTPHKYTILNNHNHFKWFNLDLARFSNRLLNTRLFLNFKITTSIKKIVRNLKNKITDDFYFKMCFITLS